MVIAFLVFCDFFFFLTPSPDGVGGGGEALTHVVSGEGVGFFNASCLRRGTGGGRGGGRCLQH